MSRQVPQGRVLPRALVVRWVLPRSSAGRVLLLAVRAADMGTCLRRPSKRAAIGVFRKPTSGLRPGLLGRQRRRSGGVRRDSLVVGARPLSPCVVGTMVTTSSDRFAVAPRHDVACHFYQAARPTAALLSSADACQEPFQCDAD